MKEILRSMNFEIVLRRETQIDLDIFVSNEEQQPEPGFKFLATPRRAMDDTTYSRTEPFLNHFYQYYFLPSINTSAFVTVNLFVPSFVIILQLSS